MILDEEVAARSRIYLHS